VIEAEQHTFSVEPKLSKASVEYESGDAGTELPKTSRQHTLSTDADGPEIPRLLRRSPPARSRNQR
jgi:hypothetical protein